MGGAIGVSLGGSFEVGTGVGVALATGWELAVAAGVGVATGPWFAGPGLDLAETVVVCVAPVESYIGSEKF